MIKVIELDLGNNYNERGDGEGMENAHVDDRIQGCFSGPPAVAMIEILIQHGVT